MPRIGKQMILYVDDDRIAGLLAEAYVGFQQAGAVSAVGPHPAPSRLKPDVLSRSGRMRNFGRTQKRKPRLAPGPPSSSSDLVFA